MTKGNEIQLLITDFDGTLVDTFDANLHAYQKAFSSCGLNLTKEEYRKLFGLRFERFMNEMNIQEPEIRKHIQEIKSDVYPDFFNYLKVNTPLLTFIRAFKKNGGHTAIASTARKKNLENALLFIHATNDFDLILAGEDVKEGKPNPEVYQKIIHHFKTDGTHTLIFEDTAIGIEAARATGANYINIKL
ncbi:MAG: HAD family phosphatase [Bacteroidaceae bacterium]|nr:HAD family phosphatase [Bacteroidaceae bacterium]